jgi:hypothetical protein
MLIYLTHDIRHLIKLSFNTPKSTRGLDALSSRNHKPFEDIAKEAQCYCERYCAHLTRATKSITSGIDVCRGSRY